MSLDTVLAIPQPDRLQLLLTDQQVHRSDQDQCGRHPQIHDEMTYTKGPQTVHKACSTLKPDTPSQNQGPKKRQGLFADQKTRIASSSDKTLRSQIQRTKGDKRLLYHPSIHPSICTSIPCSTSTDRGFAIHDITRHNHGQQVVLHPFTTVKDWLCYIADQ